MTYLHALLLGLIQGLTEFFPVSSSTHLKLAQLFLGIEGSPIFFDLFCHFGTLCVLIYFFRHEIFHINRRQILLAMLPLVPLYFLLKPLREAANDIHSMGYFLIVTGLILFIGGFFRLSRPLASYKDALAIGTMQALALIPGISRSAATISTARCLGWEAKNAVQFSFILSIPTILGGMVVESAKVIVAPPETFTFGPCFLGFFSSFITGMVVVPFAMRFLAKGNLKPFALYCLLAGTLVTLLLR